jgi:hypothetical protein
MPPPAGPRSPVLCFGGERALVHIATGTTQLLDTLFGHDNLGGGYPKRPRVALYPPALCQRDRRHSTYTLRAHGKRHGRGRLPARGVRRGHRAFCWASYRGSYWASYRAFLPIA